MFNFLDFGNFTLQEDIDFSDIEPVLIGNDSFNFLLIDDCFTNSSRPHCAPLFDQLLADEMQKNLSFNIVLGVLYGILFLVGVLGNLTVILCILLFPFMRSITNMFLLNLAVSDLLVFLLCEPWTMAYQIYPMWLYGETLCKLQPVLQGVSVSVSIYSLVSISVERFIIVSNPLKCKLREDRWRVMFWIMSVWLISIGISAPLYFAYELRSERLLNTDYVIFQQCEETWWSNQQHKQIYTVLLFGFLYLFPICFMGIVYLKLYKRLWFVPKNVVEFSHSALHWQRRRKLSVLLLALFATFGICWLPYHTVNLWLDFSGSGENKSHVKRLVSFGYPVVHFLCYASSAIDPFCSLFLSAKFKFCLKRMTSKNLCCRQYPVNNLNQRNLPSTLFNGSRRRTIDEMKLHKATIPLTPLRVPTPDNPVKYMYVSCL